MPRVRFAVAVPRPRSRPRPEIDGLRRPRSVTARSPTSSRTSRWSHRSTSRSTRVPDVLAADPGARGRRPPPPLALQLGPPETFAPVSPVVYLASRRSRRPARRPRPAGSPSASARLARPAHSTNSYPHVTIADDCPPPSHRPPPLEALHDYTGRAYASTGSISLRDHAPGPRGAGIRWPTPCSSRRSSSGRAACRWRSRRRRSPTRRSRSSSAAEPVEVPPGARAARRRRPPLRREILRGRPRVELAAGEPTFVDVAGDREAERQLLKGGAAARIRRSSLTDTRCCSAAHQLSGHDRGDEPA